MLDCSFPPFLLPSGTPPLHPGTLWPRGAAGSCTDFLNILVRFFFSSFFRCLFGPIFNRFWLDFPCQLGSTWLPKSTKIHEKSMPRGLPKLSSFFNGFLMDSSCQLQPPEPSKSLFFLWKNKVFLTNHTSELASIFDAIWMPTWLHFPSKIHQNPIKIKSQEAFKKLIDFGYDF